MTDHYTSLYELRPREVIIVVLLLCIVYIYIVIVMSL